MNIGIMFGARRESTSVDTVLDQVKRAEEDGFDNFWLPHISSSGYDALTMISVAGRQTDRIQMGTAVVPTFPRHPMALAQQAMTAQAATGGRLTLGIGPSHRPGIEDVMGLSYDRPAAHVKEYLAVLRPLVNGGSVKHSGRVFNVDGELSVPGSSPFPIIISALAPRMLRLAGEEADGTVTWMAGIRAVGSHVVPRITAAAKEAGRPAPRVCVALPVAVTGDAAAARDRAASVFERYGQLTNYRRILDIEGAEGPSEVSVIGTEAEVERQLREFAGAGATDFIASVLPVGDDPRGSVDRTWALLRDLVGRI